MNTQDSSFAEKDFYLDEFRGKTLLFALRAADLGTKVAMDMAVEVFGTLLLNDTRVVLLIETSDAGFERQSIKMLCDRVASTPQTSLASPVALSAGSSDDELLEQIWTVLRASPLFLGLWSVNLEVAPEVSLVVCAQRIAIRFKVYKFVLLDPAGGITTGGSRLSFMNGPVLRELLRQGEAEWTGLGTRRPVLEAVVRPWRVELPQSRSVHSLA